VPTPAHSGPGTSHSGRTQKVDPSSAPAAAFALAAEPGVAVVVELELEPEPVLVRVYRQMVRALEVVGGTTPASGALRRGRSEIERPAIVTGYAVAAAAHVGATAGSGAEPELELEPAPAAWEPLPAVVVVPGDNTVARRRPGADMAARTPSGYVAVESVAPVVTRADRGVEVAAQHTSHCVRD
jgi:hypothetical protein